jgi:tetratricopeptide (TPR) repeat protein/predicted Ser/Thr protein kinase
MADPGARTETLRSSPRAEVDDNELAPGQRLGRFVIERTIGAGGMGTVVEAADPDLERAVAIKVLHAGRGDSARQQRLIHEARALARIAHPNVVAIHEVGEHAGQLFIVMELIDGVSLREWLAAKPRALADKLAVLRDAARALAAAHAHGITHRDFKPENLMIDREGRAKVVDFGIAALTAGFHGPPAQTPPTLAVTQTGEAVGTPAYMAPEQLRGEKVDARSDQFGFCVTLYEAIAGARPVRRPSLEFIAAGAEVSPIELRADVGWPPNVRRVLARGLAAAPAERFASMHELLAALETAPSRRWTLAAVGGGIAAVLAVGAGAVLARGPTQTDDPCLRGEARITEVWSPAAARALGESIETATSPRVLARLGERAASWRTSYRAVCEATPVPAVAAHRLSCLDDALASMRAFIDFWTVRGRSLPGQRALDGVLALADPHACEASTPVPGAVERSPAETDWMRRFEQANVARRAGAVDDALADARELADRAKAIASDRMYARARVLSGEILGMQDKTAEAEQHLRDAVDAAAKSQDDQLAANAWGALIVMIGVHANRPEEAISLATAARAAVTRLGDDPTARLRLHLDLSRVFDAAGQYEKARDELVAARTIVETPPRQPDRLVGEIYFSLGLALSELGDKTEVEQLWQRALEAHQRAFGDEHPTVAQTLGYLGMLYSDRGEHAAGLALLERAAATQRAVFGDQHPLYAVTLGDIGTVLGRLGRHAEAVQRLERAYELQAAFYGADHAFALQARGQLAGTLVAAGEDARAIAILEPALAAAKERGATVPMMVNLGTAYLHRKRAADAERICRHAAAIEAESSGADAPSIASALACVGSSLAQEGKRGPAKAELTRALELARKGSHPSAISEIEQRLRDLDH